ncbi:unnamed protein product [Brassica oleracea]|uniref:Uncharacterized protein n=2 Tax=Brassica TaxID=3705 RepID=A0A3P6B9W6_BRAOL|nr:unnamed protein product [Brassica napus]VDC94620.1 unnamed protein product [Brassica oleracea]
MIFVLSRHFLRERENMNLMCCSSSNATKYGGVRKIESVTLAELNSFVLNASPQVNTRR